MSPQLVLVIAVATVGVLHTIVPDHWLPIALIARQEGWTRQETARAAAGAGLGHSLSTLVIGIVVWSAGATLAARFAGAVSAIASLALIAFGVWIVVGALRELRVADRHANGRHQGTPHRGDDHGAHDHHHGAPDAGPEHQPAQFGHRHRHRHADGRVHTHYHPHVATTRHTVEGAVALDVPLHEHDHRAAPRRTLLLILGSSPMIEGLPAFFAAGRFGLGLIAAMAAVFTLATVVTYVALCTSSIAAADRVHLGPVERYGEVLSGAFIALVGLVFLVWLRW